MRIKATAQYLMTGLMMILLISSAVYATDKKDDSPADSGDKTKVDPTKISETLTIDWPEADKWTPDYLYTGTASTVQLYFPEGQSSSNWEEMISVETVFGKQGSPAGLARMTYLGTVKGSPNATWDILEKGSAPCGRPFILYEIKCPDFLSGEKPQVQIWKMILGHTALYTLQYSYHDKEMPADRREHILDIFKTADLKIEDKK